MKHFLLLVLLSCFAFISFSQVNLTKGLIAWYPFNGNANDGSGNNNNPSYNNATLTTDRFGNTGSAYYFDGVDDQITIPGSAGLNTANAMTIALYFNPETTNLQTLIGKISYSQGNGTQFQVAINFNLYPGVLFGVNNPADNCASQVALNSSYVNTGGTVPINQWYCLVSTFDQGVQKIYLNGALVSTTNAPFTTLKQCTNSDIQLGTWWANDQQRYKGKIDDVRIYNRALTLTEVTALCTACSNPTTDLYFKQNVCNPLSVQLFGTGNNLISPNWDFGDGGTATGTLSPVHTYAAQGNYTINLSVNKGSCNDYISKEVAINTTAADIIITPDTTICSGTTAQLQARPGLSYCWSPATGLSNTNTANPVTSTTQNITYTCTAEIPVNNLIINGDFSSGNTGFTSSYTYSPTNGIPEGVYGVGANPTAWHPAMPGCKDHTTGTGNMMLVNGATTANVVVWSETVAVTPNTNYAFSTWLQHITTINPALLQFSINGVPIGNIFQANSVSCIWDQFYTTWNSGNNTSATIAILNQNTGLSGNDFALDDISFSELKIQREVINVTVNNCSVTAAFTAPDTVCVNTPVNITNLSSGATTYYWNFCVADVNTPPAAVNIGNPGNLLSGPVFMDYVYTNGKYYAFVVNYNAARLVRLDFGNSLLNTPTAVDLGSYGGILQVTANEGIQVVQDGGNWYAILVGGNKNVGQTPCIMKVDFGTNIESAGTATNWGNIGGLMNQPVDLHVFKENGNWYGFTVNAEFNTITRFNFGSNFNNAPTATDLGNVGGLLYPTGIYAINDNGKWLVFVMNGGDNLRIGTQSSITRLEFGSSLLNTPTGINLGNPGNLLHHPRDFTIMKFCGQIIGFAVNGNPSYNNIVRLNFNNDLQSVPTLTSLGNLGNLNFPHSISKLFRVNDEVYTFITNVGNNSITRLRFAGCTNASISSSTAQNPAPVSYSSPGTYNINVTVDDGLPTQNSFCKQVVVLAPPVHTPTQAINLCTGDSVKIGTGVKYAQYTWNMGASTDSIMAKTAGIYWVQTDRYGCTNRDSMVITALAKPVVNLGPDVSLCTMNNMVLDAGNAGASFLWQNASTQQTFTANSFGKYFVRVTNANGCMNSDTITLSKTVITGTDFYYKQDVCNPLALQFFGTGNNLANPYWAFGDGNTATGSLNMPHTYSAYGNYMVKFGYDLNGCKDTLTRTIAVQLTYADIIVTPDTTICFNATKQLRAQPALSYCWTPSSFLSNTNTANPVTSTTQKITYTCTAEIPGNNLIVNGDFSNGNTGFTSQYSYANPNTKEGEYFVGVNPQAWNQLLGTCTDHTTGSGNMLLLNGAPQANVQVYTQTVTVTPNTNYAFSTWLQNVNVNNATSNPPRLQFSINGNSIGNIFQGRNAMCQWDQFYTTWNSGNNTTATISIVNQNTIASGNDFALDDISFAPITIQRDSVVISIDTPVVRANKDTTICENGKVQLQASGAASYSWTPAAGLSSTTISNPIASPAVNTNYIVTGQTINGCTAKDTVAIAFHLVPTVITNHDLVVCPNTPIQLAANTSMSSYSWSPAATLSNPAIADPIAMPGKSTLYKVQVTDAYNCSYSDSVNVQVRTFKFAAGMNAVICQGSSITLQAIGGDRYLWSPAGSLSDATQATPTAMPDTTTQYHVTISESNCGTDTTFNVRITVNPTPFVKAGKVNDIDCLVHSAKLQASGTAGIAYLWAPVGGLDYPTLPDPVSIADTTTTYFVTGTNQHGCSAIDSVTVYVTATGKVSFEVPNAFTPNGDGLNDCLGVKSWGGAAIEEFSIFSRWGERVFTTNKPGVCWDGRYRGEALPAGGYTYIIKAKTYCGSIKRSGVVMLLR